MRSMLRALLAIALVAACALGIACQPGSSAPHQSTGGGPESREACVSCHAPEYQSAHGRDWPTPCHVCHTQDAWSPSVRDHKWPLTGGHDKRGCYDCHKGSPAVFEGTSAACVGCHRDDYDHKTFPSHLRYPTTCADCHSTAAWKPIITNHAPIPGAAATAAATVATATAPLTTSTVAPPKPTPKPRPKPKPTVTTPTPPPTVLPPDIPTGPSTRR
jgi:hypothetical protein